MQSDSPRKETWILHGAKARVASGAFVGELDVERPMRGLTNVRLANEAINGWLMGVGLIDSQIPDPLEQRWQPADAYARGTDLVVTYREPSGQPFQLQIYWRVLPTSGVVAGELEAIVSVQTREWEAYPAVSLSSALSVPGAQLHAGGVTFMSRHDWCYVEASPTGDFEPALIQTSSHLNQANWRYDKRFMERGVIRRLRLRGAFAPAAAAEEAIHQLHTAFATEAPPLTA